MSKKIMILGGLPKCTAPYFVFFFYVVSRIYVNIDKCSIKIEVFKIKIGILKYKIKICN